MMPSVVLQTWIGLASAFLQRPAKAKANRNTNTEFMIFGGIIQTSETRRVMCLNFSFKIQTEDFTAGSVG